ncbi:MAG: dephospho-CoA kinase [Deltaproteobacteria bacterium]|nr:dephospho-CoA kinase [Deltaproteobacteria bacterium]MBW2668809.1 dephospho-CoA kinase [Deltaproteobacteria bacterium]
MDKTRTIVLRVAVTGGAGSGKTSVCNRLNELGIKIISSDAMAREAVAPNSTAHKKIVDFFGETVLLSDGTLNRKMLRRMIINDDAARLTLERIVHPEISNLMREKMAWAENEGCDIVVVEVPLLFELNMQEQFDWIILVSAGHELRVKRLMVRDNISRDEAENLIHVQMPDKDKIGRADFVLSNEDSKTRLMEAVDFLYEKSFKPYKKKKKPLTAT